MNIQLRTIPHSAQRYPTCGDWQVSDDGWRIDVSDMGNENYARLVALHELLELWLCTERNISQESVDAFDIAFEAARVEGNVDEPGDDPAAPYRREHQFSTRIERMIAEELGIEWDTYNAVVESL